jgi:two-component system CheB/CheR fusion protein
LLIVGIGASAGGLKALEEFFRHMPADSGLTFVVVTHQPPHSASLLPDVLGRTTTMRVVHASDGMRVEPNGVYIAPLDGHLTIQRTVLHRLEVTRAAEVGLPIDTFFRALADDQQEGAVGIVLSGTGTDGTLGLQAIKGASGMIMVQEPQTARYDGMPRSALATGLVDYVLPPAAMPERLLVYTQSVAAPTNSLESVSALSEVLDHIFMLWRNRLGHDFSGYKQSIIHRRIAHRMNVHQIADPTQYLRFLHEYPHELDLLCKELLIGVTSFFRDPEAFDAVAAQVLPQILASKAPTDDVRVWVPGCSTGEEAYSLAILLEEARQQAGKSCKVQIFATDLDCDAIETARQGVYPEGIVADIRRDRLARFFTHEPPNYRIGRRIRNMVVFAPHNLLSEPPFTKLDLLSCRNLLIYLTAPLQRRLLPLLHYALRPDGFLFLGASETISGFDTLFKAVDARWKLFRRINSATLPPLRFNLSPQRGARQSAGYGLANRARQGLATRHVALIDRLLVERYAPPSVIINDRGDIVHVHGHAGAYLELASGELNPNILATAREGLRLQLSHAVRQACAQVDEVMLERVRIKTNGSTVLVRVSVQKISKPEALRGLLRVAFEPIAAAEPPSQTRGRSRKQGPRGDRIATLEQELLDARAELQRAWEELDASQEEFQAASEEMQCTNEGLHAATEELQSLNEALQTVNAELQSKVESLSTANDDMANLLNSTDIAAIFLDSNLHIKRFTPKAMKVFRLIPADVGRPLGDIVTALHCDGFARNAQEVLRTLDSKEQDVQTHTGTWYLMRMRPYRTARNAVAGLVITFVDVTLLKHAEQVAEAARRYAENILQAVREPLVILDPELRVVSANQAFYQYFHVTAAQTEQQYLYVLGHGQWGLPALRQRLTDVLQRDTALQDFEIERDFPPLGPRRLCLNARRIQAQPDAPDLILLAIEDVTAHRQEGTA